MYYSKDISIIEDFLLTNNNIENVSIIIKNDMENTKSVENLNLCLLLIPTKKITFKTHNNNRVNINKNTLLSLCEMIFYPKKNILDMTELNLKIFKDSELFLEFLKDFLPKLKIISNAENLFSMQNNQIIIFPKNLMENYEYIISKINGYKKEDVYYFFNKEENSLSVLHDNQKDKSCSFTTKIIFQEQKKVYNMKQTFNPFKK
jgi:hypothetical protein